MLAECGLRDFEVMSSAGEVVGADEAGLLIDGYGDLAMASLIKSQ